MMIKTVATLVALAAAAHGFSAPTVPRPDASGAIQLALEITVAKGINSPEAKVAWDIVEELDASDNSEATKGSLNEECAVQEAITPECLEYGTWLDKMMVIRDLIGNMDRGSKSKAATVLKNIKLHSPQSAASENANKPELDRALAEARLATETYGISSPEAKLAWETYEDIASSGTSNAMGTNLLDECSLEVGQEACQAMEELERVMPVLLAISSGKEN